jgi:hypothetical protein
MKKLTIEEIKQFIEVDSNSGCELLSTEYNNDGKKLRIKCKCGTPFEKSYGSFKRINGRQCGECGRAISHDKQRFTIEQVRENLNNCGLELLSKEYVKNNSFLLCKDKEGYYYFSQYVNLIKGVASSRFCKTNPYTIQNIKSWCKLNNKPFELVSDTYINAKENMMWKCSKEGCGEIFEFNWNTISQKEKECPYCSRHKLHISNCLATTNPQLISEWHPTKNGKLTPYDIMDNSQKKVWWKCKNNSKHEWRMEINRRVEGRVCPYCNNNCLSETNNLLFNNPELCKEWDYSKNEKRPEEYTPFSKEKVCWVCSKCGREWSAQIGNRNNGKGCIRCKKDSKGEIQTQKILESYNIPIMSQYKFEDCGDKRPFPFDIATFFNNDKSKLRILIEIDGQQHYYPVCFGGMSKEKAEKEFKKTQYRDLIKNNYCINNNILLLRIPYWDFDKIEKILIDVFINENMNNKYFVSNK